MPKIVKEYNKIPKNKNKDIPLLNSLTGSEWTSKSKSIVTYGGGIAEKRRLHGAAFPIDLVNHFLQIYTKEGDTVLDPFMGVGTTADAATLLNRNVIGFEINKKYFQYAKKGLDPVDRKSKKVFPIDKKIYNKSCLTLNEVVPTNSVDLIVTSPPYADHLHKIAKGFANYEYDKDIYKGKGRQLANPYSNLKGDLGNQDWEGYSSMVLNLMKQLFQVAKEGTYNVWVVRDYRDVEAHIPYVNLHGKIIDCGRNAGWILTDIVIWNQAEQRKLVKLGGVKARRFYFNIGHSYIIIFRKSIEGEKFKNIE